MHKSTSNQYNASAMTGESDLVPLHGHDGAMMKANSVRKSSSDADKAPYIDNYNAAGAFEETDNTSS